MRTNRLIGIALGCWAAVAVTGCSTENKASNSETTMTQRALSGAALVTTPTSFRSYDEYPDWTDPTGVYAVGGAVASTTNRAVDIYTGFDLSGLPNDATVDGVTVRFDARRSRTNNCSPYVKTGMFVGQEYVGDAAFPDFRITSTELQPVQYTVHPTRLSSTQLKTDGLGMGLGYFGSALPEGCRLEIDFLQVTLSYHQGCPAGTWWDQSTNACSECDSSCETCDNAGATSCRSCAPGQYLDLNADSLSGTCVDCGEPTCDDGQYLSACGPYKPTTCEACPDCGAGQYVSGCGEGSFCAPISHCGAGQRVKTPYTSRRDQVCTSCADGTYNPGMIDATECLACPAGQWSDSVSSGGEGESVGPTECYYLPQLLAIGPTSGVTDGGDSVTLIGARFAPTAKVFFGTSEATSVVVRGDAKQITALTPSHAIGTVDVTVDNNDGHLHATATLKNAFTFQGAAVPLTLSAISPASGSIAGGTTVTITGGGFVTGSTNVQFDGIVATNVTVVAPNRLTAVSPAHAKGSVNVVVINGRGGMGTLSNGFTYTDSLPPADIDAGVDDAGTSTGTGTTTSATATNTGTATSATNTGTATATSAVATATNTVVVTTNTGTGTATSVVTTNTGTATVTNATNTGTGTATSAVATGTGTATKTGATNTVTNISTGVDAGVDAGVVADGGADTKITADGGVDSGATDGAVVIPGTDAATPGTDAKIATDGGAAIDAKIATDGGAGTDAATPVVKKSDDGCSCDMGSSNANQNGGVILLVLGSVLVAIRRKRTRR
jgi:hypothetical protein